MIRIAHLQTVRSPYFRAGKTVLQYLVVRVEIHKKDSKMWRVRYSDNSAIEGGNCRSEEVVIQYAQQGEEIWTV